MYTPTPGSSPQGHALVIAIADYKSKTVYNNLPATELDKNYWSNLLEKAGFTTDVCFNSQATISIIFCKLFLLAEKAKSGDYVFIHFSGHGMARNASNAVDNNNVLMAADGKSLSEREFNIVLKLFKPGVRIWITTDACEAGSFVDQFNAYTGYEDASIDSIAKKTSSNPDIVNYIVASLNATKGQKIAASVAHLASSSDITSALDGYFLQVVKRTKTAVQHTPIKELQAAIHKVYHLDAVEDKVNATGHFTYFAMMDKDINKLMKIRMGHYQALSINEMVLKYASTYTETKASINWFVAHTHLIKNLKYKVDFANLLDSLINFYRFSMQGHPFLNYKGIPSKAYKEQTLMAIANPDYIAELQRK